MDIKGILGRCDHTLLKQEATWEQIKEICDDGLKYHCASVCIPAAYVHRAAEHVGNDLKICTVIGFPTAIPPPRPRCLRPRTPSETAPMRSTWWLSLIHI